MEYHTAIVDIDDTLWGFAAKWYEELKASHPQLPHPATWTSPRTVHETLGEEVARQSIASLHLRQHEQDCYEGAAALVQMLIDQGLRVVIASHRAEESRKSTATWLRRHGVPFHRLHISSDKSVLFAEGCLLVDDNPGLQEKAVARGLTVVGLRRGYSRDTGAHLFDDLAGMHGHLEKLLAGHGA